MFCDFHADRDIKRTMVIEDISFQIELRDVYLPGATAAERGPCIFESKHGATPVAQRRQQRASAAPDINHARRLQVFDDRRRDAVRAACRRSFNTCLVVLGVINPIVREDASLQRRDRPRIPNRCRHEGTIEGLDDLHRGAHATLRLACWSPAVALGRIR